MWCWAQSYNLLALAGSICGHCGQCRRHVWHPSILILSAAASAGLALAAMQMNYKNPIVHPACVQEPTRAEYDDALAAHPQFAQLGPLFKSCEPALLTEEETEYNIAAVVHVFPEHLLLQFNCTNTVPEQVLESVSVGVDLSEAVRTCLSSAGCCAEPVAGLPVGCCSSTACSR